MGLRPIAFKKACPPIFIKISHMLSNTSGLMSGGKSRNNSHIDRRIRHEVCYNNDNLIYI